jgi:sulfonate transport system substrate-binding protein
MLHLSRSLRLACGLALALIAVAAIVTGCTRQGPVAAGELPVLKVASQKGATKSLVLASHVLDGAPYRVEWSEFPSAQTLLEAISAGAVDAGGVGDAPFFFAYANNPKLKIVQIYRIGDNGSGVAVVAAKSSSIKTVADLQGRKIATGKGSIGHYLLLRLLHQAQLKPSDVQVVYLAPGDAKAALSSGAVDAWATWAPFTSLEVLQGGGRVVADGKGLLNSYGFLASSDAAIRTKPVQLADFLRRLTKAQEWEGAHVDEFAAALAKDTGLPPDAALNMVKAYLPETVPVRPTIVTEERGVLQIFADAGVITVVPPVDQAFHSAIAAAGH